MKKLPKCYGIIPARYRSKRFPGKPLVEILGKPMICHVYERAKQCTDLSAVVLATDDHRIRTAAETWNVPVVMTRDDHRSGTDRVLEAANKLKLSADAVVVNIQGDEPALEPAMLSELIQPFCTTQVKITTLACKIEPQDAANPDRVKVVFARDGTALYFSRSPIPHHRNQHTIIYYGHIGIYAFRMQALQHFVSLNQSRLEHIEKLEQLRLLENRIPMHIVETEYQSIGVDRPEDIPKVIKIMQKQKDYGL
jgi:3-deoxy-manno-octulosonate cytidylyltransferase (CMP-KDO synthetase)